MFLVDRKGDIFFGFLIALMAYGVLWEWIEFILEEAWLFGNRIITVTSCPFQLSSHCGICFCVLSHSPTLETVLKARRERRTAEIAFTPPKAMSVGYRRSLSRFYVKLQIYAVGIDQMTKSLFIFPSVPIDLCVCLCVCVRLCMRACVYGFWQLVYIFEWVASVEWVIVHLVFAHYCVANPVTWDFIGIQRELI